MRRLMLLLLPLLLLLRLLDLLRPLLQQRLRPSRRSPCSFACARRKSRSTSIRGVQ